MKKSSGFVLGTASQGMGSISALEAHFIQRILNQQQAEKVLEIGTASGISAALIGLFMSEYGGKELFSLDLNERFFADKERITGFAASSIHNHHSPEMKIILGKTTIDLESLFGDKIFDVIFIDANHQHPWPTLDTLACLPFLRPGGVMIHHDLSLYKLQDPEWGIGPKFLFDQIPEGSRATIEDDSKNIFYLVNDSNLEEHLADSLLIPWNLKSPLTDSTIDGFSALIDRYWGDPLADAFNRALRKF